MSESLLYSAIPLAFSHGDTRIFRVNAGMAWAGRVVKRTPQILTLANYHAVRLGPEGMSDLIGWGPGGRFLAIECKYGRGRATEAQAAFLELVRASGGMSGIARSVEDAGLIITGK